MKPSTIMMIGGVLLLVAAFYPKGGGSPVTPDVPPIPTPSNALQNAVQPVVTALKGHPQAEEFADCYRTLADVVGRDSTVIKTKSDLVRYLEDGVTLRFQGIFQKAPGLSAAIHGPDGVLMRHLGPDPGPLDHAAAKEALLAIAWAGTQ
jgi:hypothetical protein